MAKHKKPDAPTEDPKPGLVELPVAPPDPPADDAGDLVLDVPPPAGDDAAPEPAPEQAPVPVGSPDLADVKVVHDLRKAGRLWRVREKSAADPAVLVVAGTKEEAEAAFRADRPDAKALKTEKLLP